MKDILWQSFNNIFLRSTLSFQSQRNSKLLWDGQEFVEPLYPRLITIWWSGLWWLSPFPSHTEEVIFCVKNIRDLPHDTLMNRASWEHNMHVNCTDIISSAVLTLSPTPKKKIKYNNKVSFLLLKVEGSLITSGCLITERSWFLSLTIHIKRLKDWLDDHIYRT